MDVINGQNKKFKNTMFLTSGRFGLTCRRVHCTFWHQLGFPSPLTSSFKCFVHHLFLGLQTTHQYCDVLLTSSVPVERKAAIQFSMKRKVTEPNLSLCEALSSASPYLFSGLSLVSLVTEWSAQPRDLLLLVPERSAHRQFPSGVLT